MKFIAKVAVTLKKSVLDPQGEAVMGALRSMGYAYVSDVRIGKRMEVRLEADSEAECRRVVDEICSKVLANPVTETYEFEIAEER